MDTIYLVGQISGKYPISYRWRKFVRDWFRHDESKRIIDPCSNPFSSGVLQRGTYEVGRGKNDGMNILPSKDLTYVLESNIGLVNMNQYDPDKPLLGSFFEMAWYYLHPEKTVISFSDNLDGFQCQHPFVQEAVTVWCRSVEEACKMISEHFTYTHSV
jgi:hypothetical protein